MFAILRWIAFLPAAFLAALIAGEGLYWGGWFFGEFYGYLLSGAGSAAAFVAVGVFVAPKRNNAVKWFLVVISALIGVGAAIGTALGDDKLRMTAGVSMVLVSLALAFLPAEELMKIIKDARGQNA
jgi:hypothetical protein